MRRVVFGFVSTFFAVGLFLSGTLLHKIKIGKKIGVRSPSGIRQQQRWYHKRSKKGEALGDKLFLRVPYASLIAMLMCDFGVVLYCVMMTWASNAIVEQVRRSLNIDDIPWLAKVQVFFMSVALVVVIVSIVLLIAGVLSTGSTRSEIYRGFRGQFGGRVANAIALLIAYILNCCWLAAFALTAVLLFVYYMFTKFCSSLSHTDKSNCIDLSPFRPFAKGISESLIFCDGNMQQFCVLSSNAYIWLVVALIASIIVIQGFVHFLICCAANFAHVTSGSKYACLKQIVLSGDIDSDNSGSHKRTLRFHADGSRIS